MKPLLISIALLFSTPAWAEWVSFGKDLDGEYFVDLDRIRTKGGYVYFWSLKNFDEANDVNEMMSSKHYIHGDCETFRSKILQINLFSKPMGVEKYGTPFTDGLEWQYVQPNSLGETILEQVCQKAGLLK